MEACWMQESKETAAKSKQDGEQNKRQICPVELWEAPDHSRGGDRRGWRSVCVCVCVLGGGGGQLCSLGTMSLCKQVTGELNYLAKFSDLSWEKWNS